MTCLICVYAFLCVYVCMSVSQVPPVFLKQLTGDRQIFRDLPAKVQRQVWDVCSV
jgi:hypothetical protein